MAKKKKEEEIKEKEGKNLLGSPTFEKLENGKLRCVETGHELPENSIESYVNSKHCRLGLIDFALSLNKPPLNMFRQDPLTRSKLICKLTGVCVNKSEEHIWKHMNGRKFLNMLEKKEAEEGMEGEKRKEKSLMIKKKTEKNMEEIVSEIRNFSDEESDSEEEGEDFWKPESDLENGDVEADSVDEEMIKDAEELSNRTKRMTIEIGPSSFASRKKKKKKKKLEPA